MNYKRHCTFSIILSVKKRLPLLAKEEVELLAGDAAED